MVIVIYTTKDGDKSWFRVADESSAERLINKFDNVIHYEIINPFASMNLAYAIDDMKSVLEHIDNGDIEQAKRILERW